MAEAQVVAISQSAECNITPARRGNDTYPKTPGMTRVPEDLASRIRVGFGQDWRARSPVFTGTADCSMCFHGAALAAE